MFDIFKNLFRKRNQDREYLRNFLAGYEHWKGEKMDEKIKIIIGAIDSVFATSLKAYIDSQTALQIMVQKGICTADEVASMRQIVRNNTKEGKMLDQLEEKLLYESKETVNHLLRKKMTDPDSLSKNEEEFLSHTLQEEYRQKDAKRFEDIMYRLFNEEDVPDSEREEALRILNNIQKEINDGN